MKKAIIVLLLMGAVICSACAGFNNTDTDNNSEPVQEDAVSEQPGESAAGEEEADDTENEEVISMIMKINDETVQVKWENNESVRALMKMAEEAPVVVEMSMYGGFEQVGSLGTTLPSSDQNIKTKPGDIVLYTSDSIVVFYGNNSWAYTRLGHIEDRSKAELQDLLSRGNVVITISAE